MSTYGFGEGTIADYFRVYLASFGTSVRGIIHEVQVAGLTLEAFERRSDRPLGCISGELAVSEIQAPCIVQEV